MFIRIRFDLAIVLFLLPLSVSLALASSLSASPLTTLQAQNSTASNTEAEKFFQQGNEFQQKGQWQPALERYQQALVLQQQTGDRTIQSVTLNRIGRIQHHLKQSDTALKTLEQALALTRQTGDRLQEGLTLNNIGFVLLATNRPIEAEHVLFIAVRRWESRRSNFTDADKVILFDAQALTYALLQQAMITQGKIEGALEVTERERAQTFVKLLATRPQPQPLVQSPLTSPPGIQQIRQIAQQRQVTLVQYAIIGADFLYIWVVQPTGDIAFRSVKLRSPQSTQTLNQNPTSTNELTELVAATRRYVSNGLGVGQTTSGDVPNQVSPNVQEPVPSRLTEPLRRLHQLLIAPIADLLPTNPEQPVIFVPHQSLFLVPFAALQNDRGQYLIEQHTLVTAPSVGVLTAETPPATSARLDLIIGNLSPGAGTLQEATAISKLLNAPGLLGNQATKAAVVQKMSQARLMHLATRGVFDENQGLASAIALPSEAQTDGWLTATEILGMKLSAELAVLSGCDAKGDRITGDGVIGLSRSLMSAGVPSVILSLWTTPDMPRVELMTEFYRNWRQGRLTKAQALRQAMLITKQKHANPIAWSAFTLQGEWQ